MNKSHLHALRLSSKINNCIPSLSLSASFSLVIQSSCTHVLRVLHASFLSPAVLICKCSASLCYGRLTFQRGGEGRGRREEGASRTDQREREREKDRAGERRAERGAQLRDMRVGRQRERGRARQRERERADSRAERRKSGGEKKKEREREREGGKNEGESEKARQREREGECQG